MKSAKQLGFSVLHVLPMVAIVALVAVVGVKVLNQSKAGTIYTCRSSFSKVNGVVHSKITVTNNTSTAQPGVGIKVENTKVGTARLYNSTLTKEYTPLPYKTGSFPDKYPGYTKTLNFYSPGYTTRYTWWTDLVLSDGVHACGLKATGV
jgi:hypothetical protein